MEIGIIPFIGCIVLYIAIYWIIGAIQYRHNQKHWHLHDGDLRSDEKSDMWNIYMKK